MATAPATYNQENGIRFYSFDHVPHWKRFGNGSAELQCHAHPNGEWLSMTAEEVCTDGRGSSKKTMITLNEADARAFYEFLKARMERAGE